MSTVDIIAIITPKEGKIDRIIELLAKHAEFVKANEPGTLKYECVQEVNKKTGLVELIMIESYTDMGAIKKHGAAPEFQKFSKTIKDEDLAAKPMEVKFVKKVAGFARL